jgi:hypothetical protein
MKDPDGRLDIKFAKTVLVGKLPILIKVNINYHAGHWTVGFKTGIGVGNGLQIDFSDNLHEVPAPDVGVKVGLYTEASASLMAIVGEGSVEAQVSYIEVENGQVQPPSQTLTLSISPHPNTAVDYTVDGEGNENVSDPRPSLGFGSEQSILILGIGAEVVFEN